MKTYTPREGTTPSRAIALLTERGQLQGYELAELLGIETKSLTAQLARCIETGLIQTRKHRNALTYSVGTGLAAAIDTATATELEPEAPEAPEAFACALYNDGDLVLINAGEHGQENITLPKAQARALVTYLMSFAHEDSSPA